MTPTPIEILEKVNSFYSGAFTQMITVTIGVLAFAGIILPIVIQIIQSRTFRTEQASLKGHIDDQLTALKGELANEIEKKFLSEKANFEKSIEDKARVIDGKLAELSASTVGATLFVQGRFEESQLGFASVALCFAGAARYLLVGNDEKNTQRAIKELVEECLPQLNKKSFEDVHELEGQMQALIKTLDDKDEHGRYEDTVNNIRQQLNAAKAREPVEKRKERETDASL